MDERTRKARELMEPPWDEVRERRVLEQVLQRQREDEGRRSRRRRFVMIPAVAAATAACVVVVYLVLASRVDVRPVPPPEDSSTIHLADGSEAILAPGGRVEVELQREDAIRLAQHQGRVRYVVKKRKRRSFVVRSHGVTVQVVGTVFTIEAAPGSAVLVSVERGLVEVDDGERKVRLSAGEQLRVSLLPPEPPVDSEAPATPPPKIRRPEDRRPIPPPRPSIEDLLARVDAARKAGRLGAATRLLQDIVDGHPEDPAATTALFMLGTVAKERGRHLKAASAYRACRVRAPRGPLAEDALAAEATALAAGGRTEQARDVARKYLRTYRQGTHTARMEILAR